MNIKEQKNLHSVIEQLIKKGLAPNSSTVSLLMGKHINDTEIQDYLNKEHSPYKITKEQAIDDSPTSYDFFNSPLPKNNLVGNLGGEVVFVQNQTITIPPQSNSQKLVTGRSALLTFIPLSLLVTNIEVRSQFGTVVMRHADESRFDTDQPSDTNRPKVRHSANRRMVILPAHWMVPGLELTFWYAHDLFGVLTADKLDFGPPAQLILQNIRIGMLTPPSDEHKFEEQPFLMGIDYYQKVPLKTLIIAQYEAVHFNAVRMPDGELYTTASKTEGGIHDGDMRQYIGKEMVSTGINLANYGFHESAGFSESNPQHYMQIVVHTSRGVYTNGIIDHALSGGNGMCTLWDTAGNEFSHEAGHNYNLGHHPGGPEGSIHQPGPGWGFDFYRQRFIANIMWTKPAEDVVLPEFPNFRQPPFAGVFKYNTDAMAGGEPNGTITKFTHHTNHACKLIQDFFSEKATINYLSPSGYSKWNNSTKKMEPHNAGWPKPIQFGVPVTTIVGYFDPSGVILPSIHVLRGNYGNIYAIPEANTQASANYLEIVCAHSNKKIPLTGVPLGQAKMNKLHINIPQDDPLLRLIYRKGPENKDIISTQEFEPNTLTMLPPIIIGEDDWEEKMVPHIPDFNHWKPKDNFALSINKLEEELELTYGPIHNWSATDQNNHTPGALYRHINPDTRRHQYFILKQRNYSDLPKSSSDNTWWRYLGDAEHFIKDTQ